MLEVFKRRFAQSIGTTTGASSSESWAESDLETFMSQSGAQNAALFAEALHDGLMDIASMGVQMVGHTNPCFVGAGNGHRMAY